MVDLTKPALSYHRKHAGKIGTKLLSPIKNTTQLSLAYTPGVAAVCREIFAHPETIYHYTLKSHTVAIVTDGSAVLGLGNIGPKAALPVMEGKAALFKTFADLDAFPICLDTQNTEEIICITKAIAPVFGGINLEDISAPRCFTIEKALQNLGIPVMHDDQHGTAIVVLAGLLNAAKVIQKPLSKLKVVIMGTGAAGSGITQLIHDQVADLILVDSHGIISPQRSDLNSYKKALIPITNHTKISGQLPQALNEADVFIGVSKANLFLPEYLKLMTKKPIIFALANPNPEIMPDLAKQSGAFIVATGRSDYPNQINNSLAFPGVFKGALQSRSTRITKSMQLAAAKALAKLVIRPTVDYIIPKPFNPKVVPTVSRAVSQNTI